MALMIALYIAGVLSGVALVIIALTGWIIRAANELKGHDGQALENRTTTNPGSAPVARHGSGRHRRHGRPAASAA